MKRQTKKRGRLFNNSPRGTPRVPPSASALGGTSARAFKHAAVKGTGYGSREKARKTLKKIKSKPKALQKQIITTMYYRAKYHKYQTQGMRTSALRALFKPLLSGGVRNAMKVYKPLLHKGGAAEWLTRSTPAYPELWESRAYPLPADQI